MSLSDRLRRIEQQQEEQRLATAGVAQQLAALIDALAAEGEEEQDEPTRSLDGELVPGERDQSQSLG
jgi:ABC-type histidine transport system ATPase subunit